MKTLIEYLRESKQSAEDTIQEKIYSWIDYMYNEGVVDYDDRHLVYYKDRKKEPDYKDIVKGVLSDYEDTLTAEEKSLLNSDKINDIILKAIDKFVDDANCEDFC